jgi:hypothetical protein
MKITKVSTYRNPDRIKRRVLLDTDQPKNRPRNIVERIEEALEYLSRVEHRVDNLLTRICDYIA